MINALHLYLSLRPQHNPQLKLIFQRMFSFPPLLLVVDFTSSALIQKVSFHRLGTLISGEALGQSAMDSTTIATIFMTKLDSLIPACLEEDQTVEVSSSCLMI